MGPSDEALTGDLVEGYRSHRSRVWYWREVIAAIVVGAFTEVRTHKFLASRAIAIGWIVGWIYFRYASAWVSAAAYNAANFDEWLFVTGLTRWFYVHRVRLPDVVAQQFVVLVTLAPGWLLSGWIVGRLHRARGAPIVVAYVAVFTAAWVMLLTWMSVVNGAEPAVVLMLASRALLTGSVPLLLGGLWGIRPVNPIRRLVRAATGNR
jgi:hypothetical protein